MTTYFEYMEQRSRPRMAGKMPELAADFVEFVPIGEFVDVYASNTGITVRPMTDEEMAEYLKGVNALWAQP